MEFQKQEVSVLKKLRAELQERYQNYQAENLKLDMSRGKPCPEQLDLSAGLLTCLTEDDYRARDGIDCRNYGGVEGIPEARELLAPILDVDPQEVIVSGNSSLALMYDLIARALLIGLPSSSMPWGKMPRVKILFPCPGYDRHFAICNQLGIEMIPLELGAAGPDMDEVERLAAGDESIKGIWCVPKYSNPTGITYSDEVVERLAKMKTKAPDFIIIWDNAYAVHHLTDQPVRLKNILAACKEAGNPDRVFLFGSTSKISFAGAGLAMIAGSENNIKWLKKQIIIQTIGPDKLNQLRHVRFFKNFAGIEAHMKKQMAIIKPRFDQVLETLESELGGKGIAEWSKPKGGYFISLNTLEGCAKKVVKMAAEAGVILTQAGATYPYGNDPRDRNIRIAPTFPSPAELKKAMEIVAVCVQLASIEKILSGK
ncbi:MAG: aminotransferase class I/II-fold pyridoxal phosphate-dependent enzyme [Firmicutes bacterium]|nr:aminotransferase class I/II-fold pyridoxal phosphate-dependent enzyme [Bacillota bacterium]